MKALGVALCASIWLACSGTNVDGATDTIAAPVQTRLAGVALGETVLDVVKVYGAPDMVATTDDGLEWRWFDAHGIDVDLLADNSLTVRQILAARPEPVKGAPSKLVQPREYPVLEDSAAAASQYMKSAGAVRQAEPESTTLAWRVGPNVIVLLLRNGVVLKVLALDASAAAYLGYIQGPPRPHYRSPRLVLQHAVDYPKRAIEERAEGVVVVEVEVHASGAVGDVRVLVSSGNVDIDAAEMLSMRRSKFEPARCDDLPCDGVFLDREEYTLPP